MHQIVHLIPLGWDYDRIVLPVRELKAHRVYLICAPQGYPTRQHYLSRVTRELERRDVRVVHVPVDSFSDFDGTLRAASRIIQQETRAGNRVYVNVATSGKVAAIAVTLAAMAWLAPERGEIYYAKAREYPTKESEQRLHGIAKGMEGHPVFLPLFRISVPDSTCAIVLSSLAEAPNYELTYQNAIRILRDRRVVGFEDVATAGPAGRKGRNRVSLRLHQRVVRKLVTLGLVESRGQGRSRYLHLTPAGLHVSCLSEYRSGALPLDATSS